MTKKKIQQGLSLGKVAKYCGVTRKTMLRWVNDGIIPSFTLPSGHNRITPEDIATFLRKHNMPVPPELDVAHKPTVLIADDEESMRKLLGDILGNFFEIKEAENGVQACLEIGTNKPDLLLLDMHMPKMDAQELCRQLSKHEKYDQIGIIALYEHSAGMERNQANEYADMVIEKPFKASQILDRCLKIAGKNPQPANAPSKPTEQKTENMQL